MSASRVLRRRACAAFVAFTPLFALACNLLVGVPDPVPLSAIDGSAPPTEASPVLVDGTIDTAVPLGDARSDTPATDAGDSSRDETDSSDAAATCDASGDDSLNCGWCGHSCGTAACVDGICTPTAVAVPDDGQGIYALLIVANQLYFTNWAGRTPLYRKDLGTGQLVAVGAASGYGTTLSLWGSTVFYGMAYTWNGGNATDLYSVDLDAGTPARLGRAATNIIRGAKEDGEHVFYAVDGQGLFRSLLSPVAPDAALSSDQLASDSETDFDLLRGTLYLTMSGGVYSLSAQADASTPPTSLYPLGEPHAIATDGTNTSELYWYDSAALTIDRGAVDGSEHTVLATLPSSPQALAVDGQSVYVAVGPSVMAVDKDGTRLRTYAKWADAGASAQDVPTALTVDDTYLYWGRNIGSPSSVWRVAK